MEKVKAVFLLRDAIKTFVESLNCFPAKTYLLGGAATC